MSKQRVLVIGDDPGKQLAGIIEELRKQYPELEVITDADKIVEAMKPPDIASEVKQSTTKHTPQDRTLGAWSDVISKNSRR